MVSTLQKLRLPTNLQLTDALPHIKPLIWGQDKYVYLEFIYESRTGITMANLMYHQKIHRLAPDPGTSYM